MKRLGLVIVLFGMALGSQTPSSQTITIPPEDGVVIRTAEWKIQKNLTEMETLRLQFQQLQAQVTDEQKVLQSQVRAEAAKLKVDTTQYEYNDDTLTFVKQTVQK